MTPEIKPIEIYNNKDILQRLEDVEIKLEYLNNKFKEENLWSSYQVTVADEGFTLLDYSVAGIPVGYGKKQ